MLFLLSSCLAQPSTKVGLKWLEWVIGRSRSYLYDCVIEYHYVSDYEVTLIMPILIDEQTYYRTAEVCQEVEISRATLYRWLRKGLLGKSHKDRRGWRLFTKDDLNKLYTKATEVQTEYTFIGK